jgi:hypothetical protein
MDAARERSDALGCNSGIGALDRAQQDVFDAATSRVLVSSIFIWSHWDWVFGVAHSASFELTSAQAESGTGPSPARLNANAKMSDRCTDTHSTIQASMKPYCIIPALLRKTVRPVTELRDRRHERIGWALKIRARGKARVQKGGLLGSKERGSGRMVGNREVIQKRGCRKFAHRIFPQSEFWSTVTQVEHWLA